MPRPLGGRALVMRGRRPHLFGGRPVDLRTWHVAGDEGEAEMGLPCASSLRLRDRVQRLGLPPAEER